jgi:hypothetical protein
MPDINFSITGQVAKGFLSQAFAANGVTSDMAQSGVISVTLPLGTAVSQIDTSTMTAVGLCFARSLATETTHTVSIGRLVGTTLHSVVRLKAGDAAVFRLAPGALAATAAVGGTRAVIQIFED